MSGVTISMVPCFRPGFDDLVEGLIVRRTAIGIAGTVLFDGADIDLFRSQHLSPAYRDGQEMGIAKGT